MFLFYNNSKSELYYKNVLIKKPNNTWKDKKRPRFVHTNKNVIYMQKRNAYVQKHLIEKEIQSTAECQSNLFYSVNWGDHIPLLSGSYSSPGVTTLLHYRGSVFRMRVMSFPCQKGHKDILRFIVTHEHLPPYTLGSSILVPIHLAEKISCHKIM